MDQRQQYLETKLEEAEAKIREQREIIRGLELRKEQYDSIMEIMMNMPR